MTDFNDNLNSSTVEDLLETKSHQMRTSKNNSASPSPGFESVESKTVNKGPPTRGYKSIHLESENERKYSKSSLADFKGLKIMKSAPKSEFLDFDGDYISKENIEREIRPKVAIRLKV